MVTWVIDVFLNKQYLMLARKKNTMKREYITMEKMPGSFESTPGLHFEGPNLPPARLSRAARLRAIGSKGPDGIIAT